MKELILFYTLDGKCKTYAEKLQAERGADICEVALPKKAGKLKAFFLCPASLQGKSVATKPIAADFSAYDKFTLVGPIWASNPAPPLNTALDKIPAKKDVELFLLSSSGQSNKQQIVDRVTARGLQVTAYTDVKSSEL